jgi:hypothetical protein
VTFRTFELSEGTQPAQVTEPKTVAVAISAHQKEVEEANSYQPIPQTSPIPIINPFPTFEPATPDAKINNFKKTAKIKFAEACASSKRILAAIHREVMPGSAAARQIQFLFAGVTLGPYTEEQVRRYLDEGFLNPADLARNVSEKEWVPLQDILAEMGSAKVEPTVPAAKIATAKMKSPPLRPRQFQKQSNSLLVPKVVTTEAGVLWPSNA